MAEGGRGVDVRTLNIQQLQGVRQNLLQVRIKALGARVL